MNKLDIVERLRRWPNLPGLNLDKDLMREAAAEIEQLRDLEAEVKRLQSLLDGAYASIRRYAQAAKATP